MDADYADDLMFLRKTSVQAKNLLQSLEQRAKGIGAYMNSDKKKQLMCFKQDGTYYTLNAKSLK